MTLELIDWVIIAVYLIGCVIAGVWMKRYVRGVDDFAVAGREMDLNLGVASLAATEMGIVTVMYTAEMGFTNGFAGAAPGVLIAAAMFLVGVSGFVIGPLRDAGVITIPELFEKRYGKRVRWLAGLVVVLGGVLNMGIFLRLGGEFLVHVIGFPIEWLEWTMMALLGVVLLYTVLGGMLSVLVTDYIQFIVMGLGIVITSVLVIGDIGWNDLVEGLWNAYQQTGAEEVVDAGAAGAQAAAESAEDAMAAVGEGAALAGQEAANAAADDPDLSMKDPFNPFATSGIGLGWVAWQAILALAVVTTWQTNIARVLSARDSKTARKVYSRTAFYFVGRFGLPGLWGAAAFVHFWQAGGLPEGVSSLQAMPAYLNTLLPTGIIGIMIAAMLAAEMSTDSGYLLTWATVIYNDLITPLLPRPLSAKARLLTVRSLVVLIGVFLVFYGLWYQLPGRAWDYLAVTGNIYLASVFTLLVSALYWPRSNRWGAFASLILGAVGPITFLVYNAIVTDPARQIAPEAAGLSAFALAFAGMYFGSWLGQIFGPEQPKPVPGVSSSEEEQS